MVNETCAMKIPAFCPCSTVRISYHYSLSSPQLKMQHLPTCTVEAMLMFWLSPSHFVSRTICCWRSLKDTPWSNFDILFLRKPLGSQRNYNICVNQDIFKVLCVCDFVCRRIDCVWTAREWNSQNVNVHANAPPTQVSVKMSLLRRCCPPVTYLQRLMFSSSFPAPSPADWPSAYHINAGNTAPNSE